MRQRSRELEVRLEGITGRESREQECLGCGRVVKASRWLDHSQSCEELERVVELGMRNWLDCQMLGEMSDV